MNQVEFFHLPQSMASFRSIVLAINKPIIVNWTPLRIDHLNEWRGRLSTNLLVIHIVTAGDRWISETEPKKQ